MSAAERKAFSKPESVKDFPKGKVEMLNVAGVAIGRATLQPGWKWSTCVKPIAKTPSCEAPHLQYHVSGVLHVKMDDGSEFDCHPGEMVSLPPGHDAWVVGNEPVVVVDVQGMGTFAQPR